MEAGVGAGRPGWRAKVGEHWLGLGRRGRQTYPVQGYAALVQDVGHYVGRSEKPFKDIKLQIIW